ncbi:RNase A-like domain-containing protein [Chromobacterium subtsugae]|uniref:RNase A-like domain-containing protein n=1 Tax=Chromobacterium subtsugae TaxID=251747 RepID=UPI000B2F88EE|nr:RNase A-like domain-containing protein [Chromobacterium subtsugae]
MAVFVTASARMRIPPAMILPGAGAELQRHASCCSADMPLFLQAEAVAQTADAMRGTGGVDVKAFRNYGLDATGYTDMQKARASWSEGSYFSALAYGVAGTVNGTLTAATALSFGLDAPITESARFGFNVIRTEGGALLAGVRGESGVPKLPQWTYSGKAAEWGGAPVVVGEKANFYREGMFDSLRSKVPNSTLATNSVVDGEAPFSQIVDGGGLRAHEVAGGHLLEKHVGQMEQDLLDRLANEPQISGSSSFYDRATAESAVSDALDANQATITDWLNGSSGRLRIDYSQSDPIGISVSRGATGAIDVSGSRIILVRNPSMPTGYNILTGFPIP